MIEIIVQFPISGPIKVILLILEWFISLLLFEIGFAFVIRIRTSKKKYLGENVEKGFMALVFSFSLMVIFNIIACFYFTDVAPQRIFINLGYLTIMLGTLHFLYYIEKYTLILYKKHLLTKTYLILIIVYGYFFFFLMEYTAYFMLLNIPYFILCFGFYINKFKNVFVKKEHIGTFRISIFFFIIGILMLFAGYGLTTELFRILFNSGLEIRLIGDIMQVIAIGLLVVFLALVPSLSEYDWNTKIDAIVIMHKNGLLIFNEFFGKDIGGETGSLISGSLTVLKKMLEKTTDKMGTSIIEQKGKTIIIQPGKYLYGVMICTELLESLQQLLTIVIERIEGIYANILEHWTGDLKVFTPLKNIINDILEIKTE